MCVTMTEFFNYFITDDMLKEVVNFTNMRIELSKDQIKLYELKGFIALLILFGARGNNNTRISKIWCPSDINYSKFATAVMSRNRFVFIASKITFDNVMERENNPRKFYKMEWFFNQFRKNISSAFDPGQQLCVDECLYAFRGHCPFRQYIPSKPAKYGLKYWCLVCNETRYLIDVYPYLG